MERNARETETEQRTVEQRIGDAQLVLYEVGNVSLVLSTLLRYRDGYDRDLPVLDAILSGIAAVLEWQHEHADAAAELLDIPSAELRGVR